MSDFDLPNPFLRAIVTDAWETLDADAPALHEEALARCQAAVNQVATSQRSRSVLVRGQPGSGKTHLLARVRQAAGPAPADPAEPPCFLPPRACFSFVRLQTHARSLVRHVRRTLVEDLLRPVGDGPSQLEWIFLLRSKPELHKPEQFRRWWSSLRWPGREEIAEEQVEELLNRFDRAISLSRNFCAALKHVVLNRRRRDACDWLRDGELPDAARQAMGMMPADAGGDPEEESLAVIRTLARLAAPHLPIVLCFDQIEALQAHPGDVAALFAFGQLVSNLHDQTPNLVLISCVQSTFNEMLRRGVREADMDRLAEDATLLRRPTWEEAQELIAQRLAAYPAIAKRRPPQASRLWPLNSEMLRELVEKQDATPRRLIAWCRAEFERLQTGQAVPPPPVEQFLQEEFARRLTETAAAWEQIATDDTLLHGLPLAWSVGGWGEAAANAGWEEVDLVLEGEVHRTPLSICNLAGNRLTNRLDRLRRQVEQRELENLVLVRNADRPFSATAAKAQTHLTALQTAGVVLVRPTPEALQQLETLRRLLSDALAGDLANAGETVPAEVARTWLSEHLPEALCSFLEEAAGQKPAPAAPIKERSYLTTETTPLA